MISTTATPGYALENHATHWRITMSTVHFQNLIIGSGVAGKLLTWTLASQGQKAVVGERSMVGGSCPNVACLPSKNVIYSAKAVSLVHPTEGLGVVTRSVRVDMAGVAQTADGRRAGGGAPRQVQGQRRGAGHGRGAVHGTEN